MSSATFRRRATAAAFAATLALPAGASAHVTLNPKTAEEGTYPELAVRVPTESETASTTKVSIQLPAGFAYVAYEAQPGWKVTVKKEKLATPVTTDDGEITEEVRQITWTGTGKGEGAIAPGEFKDFPIQVSLPGKAGDSLTFKAIQTYSDGEVVRWIGAPDADKPAPIVKVVAPAADATTAPVSAPASAAVPAAATTDGASKGLGIAALVVAIVGALLGGAALARGRRA